MLLMQKIILVILAGCLIQHSIAQQNVSINSTGALPHASAQLDISSNNKGLLIPRMSSMQRVSISSPASGLLVFDNTTNSFWFYNGSSWINLAASSTSWLLGGNIGTNPSTNYIGTNDNTGLRFKINFSDVGLLATNGNIFWGLSSGFNNTTGVSNIGMGTNALFANTTGYYNTAIGSNSLVQNNTGFENTAVGATSLQVNTTGYTNVAVGVQSLNSNTTGNNNTANGGGALASNITGDSSVAVGAFALYYNTNKSNLVAIGAAALMNNGTGATQALEATNNVAIGSKSLFTNNKGSYNTASGNYSLLLNSNGNYNTANGFEALRSNTSGSWNTAHGLQALYSNTTGDYNTAIGVDALRANATGVYNTSSGYRSLFANTSGTWNTAHGLQALFSNTIGNYNTANGSEALYSNIEGIQNTANGWRALFSNTTGNWNTALGFVSLFANTTGTQNTGLGNNTNVLTGGLSNATAIGSNAMVDCSNCLVLGSVNGVNSAISDVNVGIGQTNPGFPLNFKSSLGDKVSFFGNSGNHYGVGIQPNLMQIFTDYVGADIGFGYGSSTGFNETMRVRGNGNVGIGVIIPEQNLSVKFSMNIDQANVNNGNLSSGITFGSMSGEGIASKRTAGGNQFGLDIYTSSVNRISITNTGSVGIGTNTPGSLFEVNGTAAKPGGGLWTATSDSRLKEAAVPYTDGLASVLKINPIRFHYNEKSGYDTKPEYIGVIAQELKDVAPYMVSSFKKDDETYLNVDNSAMIYMLINAIKDLKQQVDELKKKLEEKTN